MRWLPNKRTGVAGVAVKSLGLVAAAPLKADSSPVASSRFEPGSCVLFTPTDGNRHLRVFIDAGHGGIDPGGTGRTSSGQPVGEARVESARRQRRSGTAALARLWCRAVTVELETRSHVRNRAISRAGCTRCWANGASLSHAICALIEPLFLTNPPEASLADSAAGQEAIARGLADAAEQFLSRWARRSPAGRVTPS